MPGPALLDVEPVAVEGLVLPAVTARHTWRADLGLVRVVTTLHVVLIGRQQARIEPVDTVVLVEGVSDQIAVETLAARAGRDLDADGISIVPMGGATNIRGFVERFGPQGLDLRLAGLCDEREERHLRRALEHVFVCVADLEDELIRSLGADAVEQVIDEQGELTSFRIMQKQPDQQGRTVEQQLRRFMGTRSGRKLHYARVLIEALDLGKVPRPLEDLLAYV
jgi:hypothetical protein